MKKINIALLVLLLLIVSCGGGKKDSNLPDPKVKVSENEMGWEKDKREVTLDWYINFPWFWWKMG